MESDVRYYRRRAVEEMAAASRAVTDAARERRIQLVSLYIERLRQLNEPSPLTERDATALGPAFRRAMEGETVSAS